ncbi:hypothetical protein RGRSB_1336 [cyanobacterium endosymbiont of Rhopalodia gibberula]|uniref:hypothetical protein n=1 Tax=cyanobacterium endosymbiont of Rhopalodia gibberula TaxID=1763363 RepID=UPI000DC6E15B|nr:hypothetical protein [cyanobacterium endosymbiont of Rhopalodia gibberula]BBA79785.1 hypothetical protein RGRSB_1336 [cyanobacterium endosymbiont of Rhopalodia gibberula]
MNHHLLKWSIFVNLVGLVAKLNSAVALPPPEDIPEEILRTEIVTEGRSPIDGKPLTAGEYAEIKAKLAESPYPSELNSKLKHIIFLLKVRKMLKTFFPLNLF